MSQSPTKSKAVLVRWALLITVLLLVTALWKFTPLREYVDQSTLEKFSIYLSRFRFPLLVVVLAYFVASLVLFPVTAMVVITGLVLPPWQALVAGALGAAASSMTGYTIGWMLGPKRVHHMFGETYDRIRNLAKKNVFLSVVAIRHLPLGPFTLVNIIIGSMHLNLIGYVLGNACSLLPGLIISILAKSGFDL